MTSFWGKHQLRLDPWGADYEMPVAIAGTAAEDEAVQLGVEPGPWEPRVPDPAQALPARVAFLDGRRRLDARVLGRIGGVPLHGAFATIGVGAVMVDREARKAAFLPPTIRRVTALGADQRAEAAEVRCPFGGAQVMWYEASLSSAENGPDVPQTLVQLEMLKEEGRLAARLAAAHEAMVIRDGPLRDDFGQSPVLGYVKTMQHPYLADAESEILWGLPVATRTPLFKIGAPGSRGHRWSWYLRSAEPSRNHGLSGIVRLELSGDQPFAAAREAADQTTLLIPGYASQPHRDPRAPQNLTPVGALEKEIGRHMGDAVVIRRRVAHFLDTQAAAVR